MIINVTYVYCTIIDLLFGASKSLFGIGNITFPLLGQDSVVTPIISTHTFSNGAILSLDVHPTNRCDYKFHLKDTNVLNY